MIRATHALSALLLLGALGGCGGGLFLGFDSGDGGDGQPPTVSVTANPTSAAAGASVTLSASASDADGIESVTFFRVDANDARVVLGTAGASPYQWVTVVPVDATTSVRFFARATDNSGERTDSAEVTVTIP